MCSSIAAFAAPTPVKLYLRPAQRYNRNEQQADVAQLVEQLIRNQQVVSSSLTVGSSIFIYLFTFKRLRLRLLSNAENSGDDSTIFFAGCAGE
jgi:hypothetical protein